MLAGRHGESERLFRHDDPGDDVSDEWQTRQESGNQPNDPDQGDVNVEVLGETGADTCDFAPDARTDEAFTGYDRANALAAVGAVDGIFLNDFSAVVAVHNQLLRSCLFNDTAFAEKKFGNLKRYTS